MKPRLTHSLTALVALLVGYWAGQAQAPDESSPATRSGPTAEGSRSFHAAAADEDLPAAARSPRPPQAATGQADLSDQLHQTFLIGNPITRSLRFAELLEGMTPQNATAFREIFFSFDRQGLRYDNEWRLLWHQWGKVDPVAAMVALEEEGSGDRKAPYAASVLEIIFSSWSEHDSAAAADQLARLDDPDQYNRAYFGLLRGMDLESASRFAEQTTFPDEPMASSAAERLAERALRESGSTDSMKSWYDDLGSPQLKEAAVDHVYWRLKQADLGSAAAWVAEQTAAGRETRRITGELVADYVSADPLAGLDWYLAMPESHRSAEDTERLTDAAKRDPEAFRKWRSESPAADLLPAASPAR